MLNVAAPQIKATPSRLYLVAALPPETRNPAHQLAGQEKVAIRPDFTPKEEATQQLACDAQENGEINLTQNYEQPQISK